MIFVTELMIFVVLETIALRKKISEEKHASQNRRQTAMVFLTEFMIFMVLDTMAGGRTSAVMRFRMFPGM